MAYFWDNLQIVNGISWQQHHIAGVYLRPARVASAKNKEDEVKNMLVIGIILTVAFIAAIIVVKRDSTEYECDSEYEGSMVDVSHFGSQNDSQVSDIDPETT